MERALQSYSANTVSQVMQELTIQAVNRAPCTVPMTIIGVVVGARVAGPKGAFLGAFILGLIGYGIDRFNETKH